MRTGKNLTKGDQTRARIVAEAIPLIAKIGFEQLTYQKLADQAGLTQPALYSYFKKRIEILYACAKFAADSGRDFFLSRVSPESAPPEKLMAYLMAHLEWIKNNKSQAYPILATFYFSATEPLMLDLYNQIQSAGISRIKEILNSGNHEKHWKVANTQSKARAIHSLLIGEMIKLFHAKSLSDFSQIKDNLKQATDLLLR